MILRDTRVKMETFTKEEAKVLFATNIKNRDIRPQVIREYKGRMNAGKWPPLENESPILIDKFSRQRGGQHRVLAYIESNLDTISFPVLRDATEEEIAAQDSGLNRSFNDRVCMYHRVQKYKHITKSKVTAANRLLVEAFNVKATPALVAEEANKHQEAMSKLDALLSDTGILRDRAPLLAAFIYSYNMMDRNKWERSVKQIDQGLNITENSSMHYLNKKAHEKSFSRRPVEMLTGALGILKSIHQNRNSYFKPDPKHFLDW
jgi:hypothetical protein